FSRSSLLQRAGFRRGGRRRLIHWSRSDTTELHSEAIRVPVGFWRNFSREGGLSLFQLLLTMNDMSIINGGKFEIPGNWSATAEKQENILETNCDLFLNDSLRFDDQQSGAPIPPESR